MALLGERLGGRDVAIGIVLALALGFGLLFLHIYTAFAAQATALLFGNVLGVDRDDVSDAARARRRTLAALAIMRPLLFASLQPELAEAKGVPIGWLSLRSWSSSPSRSRKAARSSVSFWSSALWSGRRRRRSVWWPGCGAAWRCRRRAGSGRGLARHCYCLSHRLAGQLLHRGAQRFGLLRFPQQVVGARTPVPASTAAAGKS